MSQENVEIVRRFFAAMKRSFETYRQNPRSFAAALEAEELWPEGHEALKFLHPDAEWQTIFLAATVRGHLEMARTWDDYLKWVESYDVFPQEVTDLGADRVFAILRVTGKAKGDGLPMETEFFDVLTLRAGSIVRLEEYRDRGEALEAAGLSE